MLKVFKHKIALFFAMFFMMIIAAPSVILSMDDKADVSLFFGENEEEEKENLKLLLDDFSDTDNDALVTFSKDNLDRYTLKNYQWPSINLISPPPEVY